MNRNNHYRNYSIFDTILLIGLIILIFFISAMIGGCTTIEYTDQSGTSFKVGRVFSDASVENVTMKKPDGSETTLSGYKSESQKINDLLIELIKRSQP